MVEFVSANPTGPLHAGHGRGAAYGDSLARILERVGYAVSRENYLNDRGTQMQLFAASLAARKHHESLPEGGYKGEYIAQWAAEIPEGADILEWGEARAVEDHRKTLGRMNVHFDTWFSERSMVDSGAIDVTLADLRERGVVYDHEGAVWLRSTDYGDDKDRVLIKSDGEFTYLLPDIAYHRDKFSRGFDLLIDVWGADHHGYVPRMKAAMQSLGHDPAELECAIIQLVNLLKGGQPVRFSKRAGDVVELADVLDEVGPDAARLTYLLQSIDSTQNFDFDLRPDPVDLPGRRRAWRRARSAGGRRPLAARPRARARRAAGPLRAARHGGHRRHRPGPAPHHDLGARARRGGPRLLPRLLRDG
jgi:arginyl-tRNA synthetase